MLAREADNRRGRSQVSIQWQLMAEGDPGIAGFTAPKAVQRAHHSHLQLPHQEDHDRLLSRVKTYKIPSPQSTPAHSLLPPPWLPSD